MRLAMTEPATTRPRARVALPTDRMTEAEAAERIGVCIRTLQRYRAAGTGPEWSRIGPRRVRYMRQHVDAWLARCRMAEKS